MSEQTKPRRRKRIFPGWNIAGAGMAGVDRARMAEPERYLFDAVIEDLERYKPRLIFAVRHRQLQRREPMSFVRYFQKDARFREIWADYRQLPDTSIFEVAVRRD